MFYIYRIPGHIINASDFICGTCMYMHSLYLPARYRAYKVNVYNLAGIFISGTCIEFTCKWYNWLCSGTIMQQYWVYISVQNKDSVCYICNMVATFLSSVWQ